DLRRDRALAGAESDQRVQQPPLDRDEDHERDHELDLVEAVDLVRVRRSPRLWREERERCGSQMTQGRRDSSHGPNRYVWKPHMCGFPEARMRASLRTVHAPSAGPAHAPA